MAVHAVNSTGASGADDTFPKLLRRNAVRFRDRVAMRHKDLGIWTSWTWAQMHEEITLFALGLIELGLKPGDRLAIVGSNRPKLYWAIAAAQMAGAVPVPVYADSVAEEMGYVLEHADVSMAVVEDQEQVDKVLSVADRLNSLSFILYDEPRGLRDYDHTRLKSVDDVQGLAHIAMRERPQTRQALDAAIDAQDPQSLAIILYTSGTTGQPKGVMLTYANVIAAAQDGNRFDGITEQDEVIAYLPLAWVGDHVFSYAQAYAAGYCVNCPESRETVNEDRREIGPTYAFAPPRIYETMLTATMVRMEDASPLKKGLFDYFIGHARRWGEKILNGESVPLLPRLLYALGEILVYGPLKNRYGYSRMRIGYTAGEAIGPDIFRFYRSLGLNLKQLYGQTEAAVYITSQPDGEIHADTVGKPTESVEIRIDGNGEVLYRSPAVFQGYYKQPDKTAETKTADGWVRSGDAGFIDPKTGHLKIIDRAKDVGKLASGALFAPKYIENKLKFYPNIKEVVAFGQGRDAVCVFLNIDLTAVGSWAERNNVNYASYQELASDPRVYAMLAEHVAEVNRDLASEPMMASSQIHRFLILPKELDADDGELTRTQKVRRAFIAERYAPLVEALYNGVSQASIRLEVTFEDGRKGLIAGDVAVMEAALAPVPKQENAA